jgi:phosphohistidine phosphatase
MKLYVMRHGPAEDVAESGIDGDRALTAAGRQRVREVASALLDAKEEPLHVFTSPLVRAVQTAEIVAVVTNLTDRRGSVAVRRDLAPGGAGAQLARRLVSEGRRRAMLVGHEPDLSELVSVLLGGRFERPFEKAMVVGVHLTADRNHGRLRLVVEPNPLRLTRTPGA